MTGPGPLHAGELGADRPGEVDVALGAGARLEAALTDAPITVDAAFADRVMSAVAGEPAPSPTGFLVPLRRRGLLIGLTASVRQAWATVGGGGRPVFARAMALAYVLAIAIAGTALAGVATIGFAGALGIINPPSTEASPSTLPFQSTAPLQTELPSAESEPPEVEPSGEPSESPDASDDHGGSGEPGMSDDHGGSTAGPAPSDDHEDNPSPSPSSSHEDNSGPGSSGSGSSTPRPSRTPSPTDTPDPTQTADN